MNILIVGKNSYVGTHIEEWLTKFGHNVFTLESRTEEWQTYDYTKLDSIIQVAAIVHRKKDISWETYYKVNTELPVNIAKKGKENGVTQFVFLSTMGVYGKEKSLSNESVIDETTGIKPTSYYGKSKREAEKQLLQLEEKNFHIAIVRPPSVYGKNCPGNYINKFRQIAEYMPVFPKAYVGIQQSFLYIDNLSELIRLIIETNSGGFYMPQDTMQPSTTQLLEIMSTIRGKKIFMSNYLGRALKKISMFTIVQKLYGGVKYEASISNHFKGQYQKINLKEGMKRTLL